MGVAEGSLLELSFEADVIHWRGPSPFFFVALPAPYAEQIRQVASVVSYGWGMVPVQAAIAEVAFSTALFAKEGTYFLPIKAAVRRAVHITAGDTIGVEMTVRTPTR